MWADLDLDEFDLPEDEDRGDDDAVSVDSEDDTDIISV